jgi:hypothetical protein
MVCVSSGVRGKLVKSKISCQTSFIPEKNVSKLLKMKQYFKGIWVKLFGHTPVFSQIKTVIQNSSTLPQIT